MKTVSVSPDHVELIREFIVNHPIEAMPMLVIAIGVFFWAWQNIFWRNL